MDRRDNRAACFLREREKKRSSRTFQETLLLPLGLRPYPGHVPADRLRTYFVHDTELASSGSSSLSFGMQHLPWPSVHGATICSVQYVLLRSATPLVSPGPHFGESADAECGNMTNAIA